MVYLYCLRRLKALEAWLANNSQLSRLQHWHGAGARALALSGLDPALTLGEAFEPLHRMGVPPAGQAYGLSLQFCTPECASDIAAEVEHAQEQAALATMQFLEAEFSRSVGPPGQQTGALLYALAFSDQEHLQTGTVLGWTQLADGRWSWLDLWHLVEDLPALRAAHCQTLAAHLAQSGLSLHWRGPDAAVVQRGDLPARTGTALP